MECNVSFVADWSGKLESRQSIAPRNNAYPMLTPLCKTEQRGKLIPDTL